MYAGNTPRAGVKLRVIVSDQCAIAIRVSIAHHVTRCVEHDLIIAEDVDINAARVPAPLKVDDVRAEIGHRARELEALHMALQWQVPSDLDPPYGLDPWVSWMGVRGLAV